MATITEALTGALAGATTVAEVSLGFSGADGGAWTVVHLRYGEALSELYECSAVLAADDLDARPDGLLGGAAKVHFNRDGVERAVHGVVRRVEDLGSSATRAYARVVVVPSLWTLSQRVDSRIFQRLSVVAIVREVLRDAGLYQGDGQLVIPAALDALPPREYCVQHRETDLDFVMRLLQEEGVPFRFEQPSEGGERLVLVEDDAAWPEIARPPLSITAAAMNVERAESVRWFDPRAEQRPTSTTLRDYDFTRPRATLEMTPASSAQRGPRAIYDYPARLNLHGYDEGAHAYPAHDGARQAKVRQRAAQVPGDTGRGAGNVTAFSAGKVFTITGHARADADGRHLLTRVEHVAHAWSDLPEDVRQSEGLQVQLEDAGVPIPRDGRAVLQRYANRFESIPASVPFHPARTIARPIIPGVQTARVVGAPGEEIHVDFHGRIKVQFHWDRQGREDDRSSCWIRCMQGWSGGQWGFQFIPRVGMEVIVQFAEGDPDRPLVTGCVYNGENHVPYGLPEQKTRSTLKTWSSPATGGYNELRFEDKAGEEQVYVQAERDHDTLVKHDQTLTVKRHRTKVIEGRETNTIVQDRSTHVVANESKEVDGNRDEQIHGPYGSSLHVDHNYYAVAGDTLTLESGDSRIFMKPGEIFVYSNTVRIHAPKLVEIKGGLVKINCPDAAEAPSPPQPPDPVAQMLEQAMRGAAAALSGAPSALRDALTGALKGALGSVISSVLGGASQGGAAQSAVSALGSAFGGLTNPLAAGMRPAAERGVGDGVQAAEGLHQALSGDASWQALTRVDPDAARAVLRRSTTPLVRRQLGTAVVPDNAGAEGVGAFDDVARVSLRTHRGAVDGMVVARD